MRWLLSLIFITSCLGQIRVNVGGPQYTDTEGQLWAADNGCTSNSEYTYAGAITGTSNPTLYQTGRTSTSSLNCTYNLVTNNYYVVTMKFAEYNRTYTNPKTPRLMNIIINGVQYYTAVNIFQMCGFASACDLTPAFIPVNDNGQISVTITQQQGQPMLSAISVMPVGGLGLDASQISYLYPGTGAVLETAQKRLEQTIYATDFGVVANGTGSGGTSQSAAILAAIAATGLINAKIVFPAAPLCYVVGNTIFITKPVTISVEPGACIQKLYGNTATGPIFQVGDGINAISGVWFRGGGTIDGNRSNITFSGDQFNQDIVFAGASDSGIDNVHLENAATDNVSVNCLGSYSVGVGNNVQILNSLIEGAKRQNVYLGCGTNTVISGNVIRNATGGSLSLGIDVEPFASGQLTTGVVLSDLNIYGNRDGCINLQEYYDTTPFATITNVNCHDNGASAALSLKLYGTTLATTIGTATISNSNFSGGTTAAISANGWSYLNLDGVTTDNTARGLISSISATLVRVGPGVLNGSSFDIDIDYGDGARCQLAGVILVHGTQHNSQCQFPMTADIANATQYGLPWWNSNSPRDGQYTPSQHLKSCPGDTTNPCFLVTDGTITGLSGQLLTGQGFQSGTQSNHPYYLAHFNHQVIDVEDYYIAFIRPGTLSGGTIPTCSPSTTNGIAKINDSTVATVGAIIAGGGAFGVLGWCDGSNWRVMGPQVAPVSTFNTRTGAVTLTSGDVTSALTFTPANAASNTDSATTGISVTTTCTSSAVPSGGGTPTITCGSSVTDPGHVHGQN